MKPMLASQDFPDLAALKYPLYVLPKIDAIRGLVVKGQIRSRKLLPFPNSFVTTRFSSPKLEGLDGELVLGSPTDPLLCGATGGALRRQSGEPDVSFYCFDLWDSKLPYERRLEDLRTRCEGLEHVHVVPAAKVDTEHMLLEAERAALDEGYEGLILRSPDGLYKFGRATLKQGTMMKLKRFVDDEATIVGWVELQHNENEATRDALGRTKRGKSQEGMVPGGVLGAWLCESPKWPGLQFEVGGGMTDAQRKLFWQKRRFMKGKLVKFKHFPHGAKDRPRHAVFLSIREEFDT